MLNDLEDADSVFGLQELLNAAASQTDISSDVTDGPSILMRGNDGPGAFEFSVFEALAGQLQAGLVRFAFLFSFESCLSLCFGESHVLIVLLEGCPA